MTLREGDIFWRLPVSIGAASHSLEGLLTPDVLDFIARIVDSLAWPLVAIVFLVLARRELKTVLLSLKRVRYKDFEADFARRVAGLEEAARSLQPVAEPEAEPAEVSGLSRDALDELLQVSPRMAVVEAFSVVEDAVRKAAIRYDISDATRGVLNRMRELERRQIVSPELIGFFNDLRTTRNQLAHERDIEISPIDGHRYVDAAMVLAGHLSKV